MNDLNQKLTDEEMALLVCRQTDQNLNHEQFLNWFHFTDQCFSLYHTNIAMFVVSINEWLSQNNILEFKVTRFEGDLKSFKKVTWTIVLKDEKTLS
jgi:hypothetical protein